MSLARRGVTELNNADRGETKYLLMKYMKYINYHTFDVNAFPFVSLLLAPP
jgi:hypothetical protein